MESTTTFFARERGESWLFPKYWRKEDYLPAKSAWDSFDPNFALFRLLFRRGPLTWREIVQALGRGTVYGFAEIRLRRARGRIQLEKHWVAAGRCEWWLPNA